MSQRTGIELRAGAWPQATARCGQCDWWQTYCGGGDVKLVLQKARAGLQGHQRMAHGKPAISIPIREVSS